MTILQIGPYPLSPSCIHWGVESSVIGPANELAKMQNVYVFDLPRIGAGENRGCRFVGIGRLLRLSVWSGKDGYGVYDERRELKS